MTVAPYSTGSGTRPRRGQGDVVLRVWGASDKDRKTAEERARNHHSLYGYRIARVEQVDKAIPARGDYTATASSAGFDYSWAAYPLVVEQSGEAAA